MLERLTGAHAFTETAGTLYDEILDRCAKTTSGLDADALSPAMCDMLHALDSLVDGVPEQPGGIGIHTFGDGRLHMHAVTDGGVPHIASMLAAGLAQALRGGMQISDQPQP